jgi:hypothetical protein
MQLGSLILICFSNIILFKEMPHDRMVGVRFPAGDGNSSPLHHTQNHSGAHPASYPIGTGGSYPGGEAAGT